MGKKLEWTEGAYGTLHLRLALVNVSVFWDSTVSVGQPTGYKYRYGSFESKDHFGSSEAAQEAALKGLRRRIKETLDQLTCLDYMASLENYIDTHEEETRG